MKRITGFFLILAVAFMLTACNTTQKTIDPRTTVIGINQYDKEKMGEWVKCPICKGNGNCTECKGKGKKNGEKCAKCDGTGKCSSCEGQGGWRAEDMPLSVMRGHILQTKSMEQELFDGRYRMEKRLGGGGFSDVWKVKDENTGVTLALKIYKPGANVDNDGVEMLKLCGEEPYLVLAYCERGSINNMKKEMSEIEAWKLLRDISSALDYLHTRTPAIIHQDIKPDNILIWDDGTYMLTDFGVSTRLKVATQSRLNFDENLFGSAGTIAYMPPNKFSRKNLPIFANDIWSLGATVFEMLTGELPFGHTGGLIQKKGAEVPDIPDQFSTLLNDTIRSCMDADPAKRPFASKLYEIACDALKHPEKLISMSEALEPEQGPQVAPIPEPQTTPATVPLQQPVPQSEHITFDSGGISNDKNEKEGKSLPLWLIIFGVTGGIAAGVLMALYM